MYASYYKNCIVPQCKSTTITTPNKLFIYVPHDKKTRRKWLNLAKRNDANSLSTASRMYFCVDHFDLPNDMDNYMEYHIMGKVSQVRLKPGCIPSKFECQEDRRTCSDTELSEESSTQISSLKGTTDAIQMVGGDVTETLHEETGQTANKSVHCEQIASTSFQYPQASRKDDCSTNLPLKKQSTQTEIRIQSNDLDRPRSTSPIRETAEDQASPDHLEYIDSESTDSVETLIEAEPQDPIPEDMVFCEEIPFAWCRLCGEEKGSYIDTKNKPYLSNKTILTVNDVSVELDFDDVTLSRKVCHDCDRKLQEMFDFVKLVKDAQLKFNCDPLKAEIEDETDEITECKSTDDTNDKCDNNRNNKEEIPKVYRRVPVTNADFIKGTLVTTKTKHDETKRADFVKTLVPTKTNDKTKRKRKHKTAAKTKDMITERENCNISDINFGSDVSKKYGIAVDCESGKCSDDRTEYLKEALYGKITKITEPPIHRYKIVSDKCDGRAIIDIDTVENIADDITDE